MKIKSYGELKQIHRKSIRDLLATEFFYFHQKIKPACFIKTLDPEFITELLSLDPNLVVRRGVMNEKAFEYHKWIMIFDKEQIQRLFDEDKRLRIVFKCIDQFIDLIHKLCGDEEHPLSNYLFGLIFNYPRYSVTNFQCEMVFRNKLIPDFYIKNRARVNYGEGLGINQPPYCFVTYKDQSLDDKSLKAFKYSLKHYPLNPKRFYENFIERIEKINK